MDTSRPLSGGQSKHAMANCTDGEVTALPLSQARFADRNLTDDARLWPRLESAVPA